MLQLTARRADDPLRFVAPIVVANAAPCRRDRRRSLPRIGATPATLILEPVARNTAPAIALAALAGAPDALLLVMPSDHVIADVAAFRAAIDAALPLASDGWLVTFGIAPQAPDTGYGYIRTGEALAEGVRRVDRFVEKPDRATAEAYLAEGCYAWNGGIFLFRADAYLAALDDPCAGDRRGGARLARRRAARRHAAASRRGGVRRLAVRSRSTMR